MRSACGQDVNSRRPTRQQKPDKRRADSMIATFAMNRPDTVRKCDIARRRNTRPRKMLRRSLAMSDPSPAPAGRMGSDHGFRAMRGPSRKPTAPPCGPKPAQPAKKSQTPTNPAGVLDVHNSIFFNPNQEKSGLTPGPAKSKKPLTPARLPHEATSGRLAIPPNHKTRLTQAGDRPEEILRREYVVRPRPTSRAAVPKDAGRSVRGGFHRTWHDAREESA